MHNLKSVFHPKNLGRYDAMQLANVLKG